ncbi:Pre-rRNA-processing protein IPI1 [Linum perenne]
MPKSNASSKKQQKRGIDFKKIKRKIGRKLPPPKNTTNTEVKWKAIVLPEQSVASEKTGLAVSKKGLTLKELLQQTSHHNAKVRKGWLSYMDSQGPLISMLMAYIFNAMTHLAIDVRLMAFKFFNLIVEYHPDAFVLHAEKVIPNLKRKVALSEQVYDRLCIRATQHTPIWNHEP